MKLRLLSAAVMSLFLLAGCTEDVNPSIFETSPNVLKSEPATGHDVRITLKCDKPYEVRMAKGEWIKVKSDGASSGKEHDIVLSIQVNETGVSRSDNLIVDSGNRTTTVSITQVDKVTLVDKTTKNLLLLNPVTLTISPGLSAWNIQQVTSKAATTDWLTLDKTSGPARTVTSVTLTAKSINLGSEPREAILKVTSGTEYAYVTVTQSPSAPAGAFSEANYGIYNYDGKGSDMAYDRYAHQLSTVSGKTSRFRIVNPMLEKIVEWSWTPGTFVPGKTASFTLFQNITAALPSSSEVVATVYKTEGDYVWLVDDNGVGYVIKK